MNVCQREIPGYSATFLKLQKIFTLNNPKNHIWYPAKERKGPAIPHIQTTPVQKGKRDSRQTYFNGSSNVTPFQKIASMRASTPTILLTCYLNVLLSSYQIQTVARRSQARLAAAIVLLGGGDAGMTHRILHRNQVFPIIQHGRGKSTP